MPHTTLSPIFTGLRVGLHALLLGLAGFAVARSFAVASPAAVWSLVVGVTFVTVYLLGVWAGHRRRGAQVVRRPPAIGWVAALTVLWALLTWLTPEGAFLVFPLFFLYLHVVPGWGGGVAIVLTTTYTIVALGLHVGFSVGGVIGPLVAAGVALLIGLAYRTLTREVDERERLLAELIQTQQQLAETERQQGALAERARLAREIHDTVAQGLSSIQMLLHAAERHTSGTATEYLGLARGTAADSLAETRQIIRELTPERLEDGLAAALRRLGREQADRTRVNIEVRAKDDVVLPMTFQTALLRIAQGALSNAVRHAAAQRIVVELTQGTDLYLSVVDDGRGFDVDAAGADPHGAGSFGLHAMRERVEQLDGHLVIASELGKGTRVTVRLPLTQLSEEDD
ncbi:sensor histidine kinase [Zhihengliuella flava]|uniref:Oxygen sensor histidine kinase NreB n=1 Tax=Zhihengliuella flava TaxID=1285193 RepID=A0A931DEW5_9MICC|nr:sensor histidine kinase [Zhihengliuella flava]MBG6085508.1 signal transduction histidine kinase [Zhihengliuella flava]